MFNALRNFLRRPSEGWDPGLLKKNLLEEKVITEERAGSQPSLGRPSVKTIAILLLSVTIFLGLSYLLYQQVILKPNPHTDVDSKAYIAAGEIFYHDKSFARLGYLPYYGLGYPLFIGALYTAFGQVNILIVVIAQLLLSLLAGLLMFITTRRLFGDTPAIISALLFSCNLGFIMFSQFILTEILLAFMLVLFFERFTAFLITKKYISLMISGLVLGLSMIVKPAALYYAPCLVFFIICTLRQTSWKKIIAASLLFLAMFYIPVMGYRVHNKIVFNSFKLGALSEVNILFWFFPHVLAEKHGTTSDYERMQLRQLEAKWGLPGVRSFLWEQINHNPLIVVYAWLKNTFKTWLGLFVANLKILVDTKVYSGQYSFFRMQGSFYDRIKFYVADSTSLSWVKTVSLMECCWQIVRYLLVIVAFYYLMCTKQYLLLLFLLSYLGYFSLITGHDGCARFRMMFEGPLIMLSALGAWRLWRLVHEQCLHRYFGWRKRFSPVAAQ